MNSTGRTDYDRLSRIEQVLRRDVQAATRPIEQAWASYVWEPLPDRTQAAAWSRLLSFSSHLLGIAEGITTPIAQAVATQSLSRWLKLLGMGIHQAILLILEHENKPDILLAYLVQAAAGDVTTQVTDLAMERSYHLLSPKERMAYIDRIRKAFPATDAGLNQLPSWAFVDKLPQLHRLCAQELQQRCANKALGEEPPPPWQNRSDAQAAHHHTETEPV
jgi:hypothetical protein